MSHVRCPIDGKRGYVSEDDARKALRRAQGQARKLRRARLAGASARAERRYYYHAECGRYHLTSQPIRSGVGVDLPTAG